jgi:uncharacterized protein with PhoU and TrkA domain
MMRWSPERLDQIERAIRDGRRVAIMRRGTEYIVIPTRMTHRENQDAFVGRLPMTGEELVFVLTEMEAFQVL